MQVKIATWNVNSLKVRLPQVLDWLAANTPDVLCLQETKLTDDNFPAEAIEDAGYHVVYAGEKTYNGVAVISRDPATDIVTDPPGLDDTQRRVLAVSCHGFRILNLYVVNGQEVGSDKYAWKLEWISRISRYVHSQLKAYLSLPTSWPLTT